MNKSRTAHERIKYAFEKIEQFLRVAGLVVQTIASAAFIIQGALIGFVFILLIPTLFKHPEIVWNVKALGAALFLYLVGVIMYNGGIEHFPRIHWLKAPAPRALNRIALWFYKEFILVERTRAH